MTTVKEARVAIIRHVLTSQIRAHVLGPASAAGLDGVCEALVAALFIPDPLIDNAVLPKLT